jgi:hypothetical protein
MLTYIFRMFSNKKENTEYKITSAPLPKTSLTSINSLDYKILKTATIQLLNHKIIFDIVPVPISKED